MLLMDRSNDINLVVNTEEQERRAHDKARSASTSDVFTSFIFFESSVLSSAGRLTDITKTKDDSHTCGNGYNHSSQLVSYVYGKTVHR